MGWVLEQAWIPLTGYPASEPGIERFIFWQSNRAFKTANLTECYDEQFTLSDIMAAGPTAAFNS